MVSKHTKYKLYPYSLPHKPQCPHWIYLLKWNFKEVKVSPFAIIGRCDQKSFYLSYRTIQSLRPRVAWSYTHHRNPIKDFYYFFSEMKPTNTAQRVPKIFHNSLFLFFGWDRSLLQLFTSNGREILVQLTLLISKTGFGVWVLDWSVRHILFCTWITGLFHYHFINNGSCLAIGHLCLQNGESILYLVISIQHLFWYFLSNKWVIHVSKNYIKLL